MVSPLLEVVVISDTNNESRLLLDESRNLIDRPSDSTMDVSGVMADDAWMTSIEMVLEDVNPL